MNFRCVFFQVGLTLKSGLFGLIEGFRARWWFQILFIFDPNLGKIPNLTNIFQMG